MTLDELAQKPILILGFGTEGQATYDFLRKTWPAKLLAIADQRTLEAFPAEVVQRLQNDPALRFMLGPNYLDGIGVAGNEVIIKTPGIPASTDPIVQAVKSGSVLTSHSQIFLDNYPRHMIIGVTGTKGKSTTTSLIWHILRSSGVPAELVGNIGQPPLARIRSAAQGSYFVHEFSSHQLAEVTTSPHIAVLLNIVPEHLDYYRSFAEYVAAKENITRFQTADDFLIFNADYTVPRTVAERTRAEIRPLSLKGRVSPGCYRDKQSIVWSAADHDVVVMSVDDIPLAGSFNVENVVAAVAVASLCKVSPETIRSAVRSFQPLPHRLEQVGTFKGVTFYDDSIATVPEATLAALEALGPDVQTLILGGHERHLDFTELGTRLPINVKTVILFPATGPRIWKAIESFSNNGVLPQPFFVDSMEQAVAVAYEQTEQGKICLLSPASPSFGMFKDYRERGDSYKMFVKKLA